MNDITKEFFQDAVKRLQETKQLNDSFLILMYEYYQNYFPKYRHFVTNFFNFKEMFYLWINTPVSYNNQIQYQTYNKGIRNTINYFNQKFKN